MRIIIAKDRDQLGQYVAQEAACVLRKQLVASRTANMVVATGASQFEVLEQLVLQPDVDWRNVQGYHLDEYLGISIQHPASFCGYLKSRFVDRVPLGSFNYLDGTLPTDQLIQDSNQRLLAQSIDLMLCGIGENGHLAFNDPPADFEADDAYLIVQLDEACRRQQVGEGWFRTLEEVPTQAISMSIRQIMRAKAILCSVPDLRKAEAVRNALEGQVSPMVPASILQQHPNVQLILDTASSSLLGSETLERCERLT